MFDELNYFEYDQEEIEEELKKYFREMPDITEEQVEERKDVALEIFFLMLFFMGMVKATDEAKQYQDLDYYIEMLGRRYGDIVSNRYGYSQSLSEYAPIFARSVVNTTFSNQDNEDTLSVSRAVNIAENEANTIVNEADYNKALGDGKTHKKWITERDERVRPTHKKVDGKVLPIKEFYIVGNSKMLYAHDAVNGSPSQVIGCRCHMEYLNKDEKDNEKSERENEGENNPKAITSSSEYAVKSNLYSKREFLEKIEQIANETGISKEELTKNIKEMLIHRSGTNGEDIYWYDTKNKSWLKGNKGKLASQPEYLDEMKLQIAKKEEGRFISFHNHPANMPPSYDDFNCANDNKYKNAYVIGHDGSVYKYNRAIENIPKIVYNANYIKQSRKEENIGLSEKELQNVVLNQLKDRYGIEWSEL